MDDSSGDERYSCFHLERPLQITVANEQVRRESRSRRRDQSSERPRHGRSWAHAPSVHRGSDVQEGRRQSRDRDLRLSSRSRQGSRLESRVVRASYPEGGSMGHQSRERQRCHEGSFSWSQAGSRLESVPSVERTERGRSPCRSHVGSKQRHEVDSGQDMAGARWGQAWIPWQPAGGERGGIGLIHTSVSRRQKRSGHHDGGMSVGTRRLEGWHEGLHRLAQVSREDTSTLRELWVWGSGDSSEDLYRTR